MSIFCRHKWKILGAYKYIDTSFNFRIQMTAYHLQCEKCGNLKEKTLQLQIKETEQ